MSFNMSSLRNLMGFASGLMSQIPLGHVDNLSSPSNSVAPFESCPSDGPVSCHNSTTAPDSCCFIYPGGQLLQTQFWDTSPTTGPSDSWTIHGLWPDLCDGSYEQYCKSGPPQYKNITQILTAAGETDLLDYMNTYWVPESGTLEYFWEHEFNKHATCINTLSPNCYGDDYTPGTEVVDFFTKVVETFKGLDTYSALKDAGITPSSSKTYTLQELTDALTPVTGEAPVLGCYKGRLEQAWYAFNVKGSLQDGKFVASSAVGAKGSCPSSGIKYLPKD